MAIARVGTPGLCFVTTVLAASFSVTFQSCTISALTVAGVRKPAQNKVAKRKRYMENSHSKVASPRWNADNASRPSSRCRTTDPLQFRLWRNLLDTQLRKEIVDDAKAV